MPTEWTQSTEVVRARVLMIKNYISLLFRFPCFVDAPSPHARAYQRPAPLRALPRCTPNRPQGIPTSSSACTSVTCPRILASVGIVSLPRSPSPAYPPAPGRGNPSRRSMPGAVASQHDKVHGHGLLIAEYSISYTAVMSIPYLDNRHG